MSASDYSSCAECGRPCERAATVCGECQDYWQGWRAGDGYSWQGHPADWPTAAQVREHVAHALTTTDDCDPLRSLVQGQSRAWVCGLADRLATAADPDAEVTGVE